MARGGLAVAVAVFLGTMVVGVIAVVAMAVRREDRRYTLPGQWPGRLARSTRRLTGVAQGAWTRSSSGRLASSSTRKRQPQGSACPDEGPCFTGQQGPPGARSLMTSQFAILMWGPSWSARGVSPAGFAARSVPSAHDEEHQGRGPTDPGVASSRRLTPTYSVDGWRAVLRLDLSRGAGFISLHRLPEPQPGGGSGGVEASGPRFGGAEPRAISPDVAFSRQPTPALCQPSQPLVLPHSVESSPLSEFLVRA